MASFVYIHIPFCNKICSYCDFSKIYYDKNIVSSYLEALEKEINLNYKKEKIKTLYIGGGTPSFLDLEEFEKLFNIISVFDTTNLVEFTLECNVEDLSIDKLKILKKNGVNRLSIGVQTFNNRLLKILGRNTSEDFVSKILLAKSLIPNINIDLIFGIPTQTLSDVKKDLKTLLSLDIPHVSYYSLIIEPHTDLYNKRLYYVDEEIERKMYDLVSDTLSSYDHYEISNYSKIGFRSLHNLNYWNNDEYYGFGLGSHGFINNIRYENTRSINRYLEGKYQYLSHEVSKKENMENEMILGLRKLEGIDNSIFKDKFNCNIDDIFQIEDLLDRKLLEKEDNRIFISNENIYVSNEILERFML